MGVSMKDVVVIIIVRAQVNDTLYAKTKTKNRLVRPSHVNFPSTAQ